MIDIETIYASPELQQIEEKMLMLHSKIQHSKWRKQKPENIESLMAAMKARKQFLNSSFVPDETTKQLLLTFNDMLSNRLRRMRQKMIRMFDTVKDQFPKDQVSTEGLCFLEFEYPQDHPIQTQRAKAIWQIMSSIYKDQMPNYAHGVNEGDYIIEENFKIEYPSEEDVLYSYQDKTFIWHGAESDENMNREMNLIYACIHLYTCTCFSIFDLLWVREVDMAISTTIRTDRSLALT